MVIFSPAGIFTRDAMFWSPSEGLCQGVQGGARLEPPDLLVGQGVLALDGDRLPAGLREDEGQGQDALLLQVGLVDAREAPDDDDLAAQIARRHRGVLTARALAVVLVTDHRPRETPGLELPHRLREVLPLLARDRVGALAHLAREGIVRAEEHVVADLVEMPSHEKP